MDPSVENATLSLDEEDEWDTDGFVIPSVELGDADVKKDDDSEVDTFKHPSPKAEKEESIYLGPHGAPRSQYKQQEGKPSSRKQQFKQKLREADRKVSGSGRENKVENLRELVGTGRSAHTNLPKGSSRDWLDPHCRESEFEKLHRQ